MTAVARFGDLLRMCDSEDRLDTDFKSAIRRGLRPGNSGEFDIERYIFKAISKHLDIRSDPFLIDGLINTEHDALRWRLNLRHRPAIDYYTRGPDTKDLYRLTMLYDVQSDFRRAKIGSGNLRPDMLLSASRHDESEVISLIGVEGSVSGTSLSRARLHTRMETSEYVLELAGEGSAKGRTGSAANRHRTTCFATIKRSLWQAKIARTLVLTASCFTYCGSRFGMVRIHEQWGRLFTLNDKTIALECSDDFLSARGAGKTPILESAAQFLADEDNSAHLPHTLSTSTKRMFDFVRRAGKVLLNLPATNPLPPVDCSPIYGTSLKRAPSLAFLESWKEPHARPDRLPRWPPGNSSNGSDAMDVSSDVGMEAEVDPTTDVDGPEELPQPMEMEDVDCPMGDVQGISKADFLSLPSAIERTEIFLESMQIDDGPTESSMTERSTTVDPYERRNYGSSHGNDSLDSRRQDEQTDILLSILDRYDVRLVLVSRSEMDELAGMTPPKAKKRA